MKKIKFFLFACSLPLFLGAQGCSDTSDSVVKDDLLSGEKTGNDSFTSELADEMPDNEVWNIIFEDDFTGSSETPDPSKWVLCEKGDDSWNRYLSGSYAQAYQKDGSLFLIAERVDGEYLTGGIETRGKFDFQYGKVECRARFVRQPHGNHTGIWMMPAPPTEQWPKSGEIDIMEHLGAEDVIYETVHSWYADDIKPEGQPTSHLAVTLENKDDWNTYGIIWTPEYIEFTVNGVAHLKYDNLHLSGDDNQWQWPFDHHFYLILSQSLGGEGTWAGEIDNDALPAIFEIDKITVWQKEGTEDSGVKKIFAD